MTKVVMEANKNLSENRLLSILLIENYISTEIICSLHSLASSIKISFYGVRDIHFPSSGIQPYNPIWLEISDIKEDQMEDINYTVSDTEEEVVKFSCQSYIIKY